MNVRQVRRPALLQQRESIERLEEPRVQTQVENSGHRELKQRSPLDASDSEEYFT